MRIFSGPVGNQQNKKVCKEHTVVETSLNGNEKTEEMSVLASPLRSCSSRSYSWACVSATSQSTSFWAHRLTPITFVHANTTCEGYGLVLDWAKDGKGTEDTVIMDKNGLAVRLVKSKKELSEERNDRVEIIFAQYQMLSWSNLVSQFLFPTVIAFTYTSYLMMKQTPESVRCTGKNSMEAMDSRAKEGILQ
uniref:Uncharacterized protein n=1 Tax=Pristionchus pacificus TaxID=54126 RepID=A0A8R1Z486_PRIPA